MNKINGNDPAINILQPVIPGEKELAVRQHEILTLEHHK